MGDGLVDLLTRPARISARRPSPEAVHPSHCYGAADRRARRSARGVRAGNARAKHPRARAARLPRLMLSTTRLSRWARIALALLTFYLERTLPEDARRWSAPTRTISS